MPSPSAGYQGVRRSELRYDMLHAIQNRLLGTLRQATVGKLTPKAATTFWTSHSARSFLPSAASTIGYKREDRDYLGGWSTQARDRYSRVSKLKAGGTDL